MRAVCAADAVSDMLTLVLTLGIVSVSSKKNIMNRCHTFSFINLGEAYMHH